MKLFLGIFIMLGAFLAVYADSWGPPEPVGCASPSGRYVLRIFPGDIQRKTKPMAVVFELSKDGGRYVKTREFPLLNRLAPVQACISNTAEVVTFDDWGGMGYDHVVVWYSPDGNLKTEYTLAQLFPEKQLSEIRDNHRSVSSIHWLRGVPYFNGSCLIMQDVLGGYVSLSGGIVGYMPQEQK